MDFLGGELDKLRDSGLYRKMTMVEGPQGAEVRINGENVVMLCSNNYLGLANHPALKKAAKEAVDRYGCGTGASRLIAGNMELHERLEERIASFKGTQRALVFNSGYHTNLGIISSLVRADDYVFSDEWNHASIVDGCRLSRANIKIYGHADMNHLEGLLKKYRKNSGKDLGLTPRFFIVTDTVFSMDGDIAPLPRIVGLAGQYDCITIVDDAHATGILGDNGRGAVEHFHLEGKVDVQMGTLSKALAGIGGYVAGSPALIDFMINKARPFIYTTSLPPASLASAMAAIDIVEKSTDSRARLRKNVESYSKILSRLNLDCGLSETHIIPIIIGDSHEVMRISRGLMDEGVFVQGIRYPSVPHGKARLRTSMMATHTNEHLRRIEEAFEKVFIKEK